jgi:ABC-type transport system involved in multi-copper enzyme maturation permease subunit
MLIAVAVRASGTVSGERDRQTLDGLLTTPLGANSILAAKWLGSILSVRWAWLWLGAMWLVAMVTGGLSPLALPFLPIAWFIYAAFFASVGLFYSIVSHTTLRSTMWTLVTVVGLGIGHWLISSLCCFMPLSVLANVRGRAVEDLMTIEFGQSPPLVLGLLAFEGDEWENWHSRTEMTKLFVSSVFGLIVWAGAAMGVWFLANARFRVVTGRTPYTPVVAAEVVPTGDVPTNGTGDALIGSFAEKGTLPLPTPKGEG